MSNIGVIGLGVVGKTIAFSLLKENIFDNIYLLDLNENSLTGELLDLNDSAIFYKTKVLKGDYESLKNVDFVVITAGIKQSSTSSRLEQTDKTLDIFDSILDNLNKINYQNFIIICSNPVDILTFYTVKKLNYNPHKVIGSGTLLDTNRLINILSRELKIDQKEISGYVFGEHGSSAMIPYSLIKIANMNFEDYLENKKLVIVNGGFGEI